MMIPPTQWSTVGFTDITGHDPDSCEPFAEPLDYLLVIPGPTGVLCELALIPADTVISSLEDPAEAYEPLERAITLTRPGTDLLDRLGRVMAGHRDTAYLTLIPGQAPPGNRLRNDLVRALVASEPSLSARDERSSQWRSLALFGARPGGPRSRARAVEAALIAGWARVPMGDARFPIVRRLVATVARTSHTPTPPQGLARAYELAWSLANEPAPTPGMVADAHAEAEALAAGQGL